MNEETKQLTDSELAEIREEHRERDHRRWLWTVVKRLALWIAGLLTGAHAVFVALRDATGWMPPPK